MGKMGGMINKPNQRPPFTTFGPYRIDPLDKASRIRVRQLYRTLRLEGLSYRRAHNMVEDLMFEGLYASRTIEPSRTV